MKHFPGPWFRGVTKIFQNPLALVGGILLCLSPIAARGQSVSFAGTESVLPTNGLDAATGVAVDSSGNVVISDFYNHRVVVLSKTPTGYAPQANLPTSGLSGIYGVAVDVAGDIFIPDGFNYRIVELPKTATGYGSQIIIPCAACGGGSQIALDFAGDIFFTAAVPVWSVQELPRTGTGYGSPTILPTSGLQSPNNLAVDATGDVFIVDAGNDRVVELRRTATGYAPQTTLPFSGLNESNGGGVAVDSTGNDVFVADTENNRVLEEQMTATGWGPQTTLLTGSLNFPRGLFLDSTGDLFIADQNNNRVLELQTVSVNFEGANVCAPGATTPAPCSQTLTLTYNVNADTTLGEPQVATGGVKYLDFNRASAIGGKCVGAVTAGTTCTVKVTFAPLAAGFRHGSVSLPGGGHDITTTQLSGFGIAATTGAPVAQLSTTPMSFGAIDFGTIKTLQLFVANIGGGTLTVTPSISGPSYKIADSTCAAGVTPGNSCTLVVEYSPVSIGTHDDTLTVATNGGSPTVGLEGSVVGLSVLGGVSGGVLRFGPVSPGSTKVLPLTVSNVGLPGTVMVGTAISGPSYSILIEGNTCMAGIAEGQSCTLPVQASPATSGLHDDLLTLTPFPGAGSTTVWLSDNPSATTPPYDAAAQFSGTANPNGVWSYGCTLSLGAAFQLDTQQIQNSGLYGWGSSSSCGPNDVGYNPTNADITDGSETVPAHTTEFHPGPEDQNAVLRFTAPAGGNYQVKATFWGDDFDGPTTTDVHVLHNGLGLYTGEVDGYGRPSSDQSFTTTISVAAGDTIDFAVGYGTNGNYFFDTTGVSAVITPE